MNVFAFMPCFYFLNWQRTNFEYSFSTATIFKNCHVDVAISVKGAKTTTANNLVMHYHGDASLASVCSTSAANG